MVHASMDHMNNRIVAHSICISASARGAPNISTCVVRVYYQYYHAFATIANIATVSSSGLRRLEEKYIAIFESRLERWARLAMHHTLDASSTRTNPLVSRVRRCD